MTGEDDSPTKEKNEMTLGVIVGEAWKFLVRLLRMVWRDAK